MSERKRIIKRTGPRMTPASQKPGNEAVMPEPVTTIRTKARVFGLYSKGQGSEQTIEITYRTNAYSQEEDPSRK